MTGNVVRFAFGNGCHCLFHIGGNCLIDLLPEQLLCFADDDFLIRDGIALLVHRDRADGIQLVLVRLAAIFMGRGELLNDLPHKARSTENAADIGKEEVGHKAVAHHLRTFQLAGNGQHLRRIQLHHTAVFVLAQHREEVEQPSDVLFSVLGCASRGGFPNQVVGELVVNNQRPGGVEVEQIRPLLAVSPSVHCLVGVGILCPEGRLHIGGRALHIAEHENPAPLRDSHANGQLSHRQSDGLFVGGNRLPHLIIGALCLLVLGEPSVSRSQHDLIFCKQRL